MQSEPRRAVRDAEPSLWSAFLVRQHVVPHVRDSASLVALALAFPAALGAPAAARLLAARAELTRPAHSAVAGALVAACARADCAAVAALASRSINARRVIASDVAPGCPDGRLALARLPGTRRILRRGGRDRTPSAMQWMCARMAAASGSAELQAAVGRCGLPEARAGELRARDVLWVATTCGVDEAVEALALPPFSLRFVSAGAASAQHSAVQSWADRAMVSPGHRGFAAEAQRQLVIA
eukprot:m51a1_g2994 hypothetical protein (241) ;mRNA; f:753602-754525